MELSTKEQRQSAKLNELITKISDKQVFFKFYNVNIKIILTPDNEKLKLFRDELKAIQETICNYNAEFKDLAFYCIDAFRDYYKYFVQDIKTKDDDFDLKKDDFNLKNYLSEWQQVYVSAFFDGRTEFESDFEYLDFDYDSIDFKKFEEIDFKWFDDPAKYIPLTDIDQLSECMTTINYFQKVFDYYHLALENKEIIIDLPNRKQQQKQQQNTYQWLTNPEKELPELYSRMIKGKFISQIDFPAFRSIFTGQPVQSIATKIQWLTGGVLLAYFIDSIRNKLPMATDVWSVAKHCFENAGSLKQSHYNYSTVGTGKPKQHKLIDDLLKDL